MSETNQEGYQTLGWIINESEYGFYLVVADEQIQEEIADVYRLGAVEIYDCKKNPGEYSFQKLREKLELFHNRKTVFIQNFHMAVQDAPEAPASFKPSKLKPPVMAPSPIKARTL